MKLSWRTELPQWALLVGMFGLAAASWTYLPERLPVHWDARGEADRYGSRAEALFLLPLISMGLYLLMIALPYFDPGRANYQRFAGAYNVIRLSLLGVLALIYGAMLLAFHGYGIRMESIVPLIMGVLLVVLGNFMGKIRPNWFVGIRTPWTLSSKLSWTRTHRLGGWLFIIMGLSMFASAFAGPRWLAITAMAVIPGLCVLWLVIYSYLVWRKDPDRVPPTGTEPANDG